MTEAERSIAVKRKVALTAMTEAERSIAVKRKVALSRAATRDSSPAEVYSPKRKSSCQSHHEESPPPYIPSRKDNNSQSRSNSCVLEANVPQALRHDGSGHRLCQDDCRKLISKYRRDGLLKTIGIDRVIPQHSKSLRSPKTVEYGQEKGQNFTCQRVVRSDNSSKSVQNFKITTNVISCGQRSVSGNLHTKTQEHRPPLEQAVKAAVSPNKESRISITARLGKVVVDRPDTSRCTSLKEVVNTKVEHSKSSLKSGDNKGYITTLGVQSKLKGSNLSKFDPSEVISSLARAGTVKNYPSEVISSLARVGTVKNDPSEVISSLARVGTVKNYPSEVISSMARVGTVKNDPSEVISSLARVGTVKNDPSEVISSLARVGTVKNDPSEVISSMARVGTVKKQTEATILISKEKTQISEKSGKHFGLGSKVGHAAACVQRRQENITTSKGKAGVALKKGHSKEESSVVNDITSCRDKAAVALKVLHSKEESNVVDFESSDDDLAKMIDEEPKYDLCDGTQNKEFALDLSDVDTSSSTKDIENKTDIIKMHKNIEKKSGIRFIVTLDGVDERQFDSKENCSLLQKATNNSVSAPTPIEASEACNSEQAQQKMLLDLLVVRARSESQKLLQKMKALTPTSTRPPSLPPSLTHSLSIIQETRKEFDDQKGNAYSSRQGYYHPTHDVTDEESAVSAIKRAKMAERCRFWPACSSGTSCEYHHPTTRCILFPGCKFGSKCLYIHPNCRFDSKCTRPNCPYTHTSRKSTHTGTAHVITIPTSHFMFSPSPHKPYVPESSSHSSQTTCRYFPHCQNLNCPFVHPKPCKFGLACNSPACLFYHPCQLHDKNRLKWQTQIDQTKPYMTTTLLAAVNVTSIFPRIPSPPRSSHSTTVSSTSH